MSAVASLHRNPGNLDFSRTRADLLEARHLPGEFYTSPELFELEIDQIFMKDWICVGRVEQYSEVGDYRALRIANEPLLICKNRSGKLGAFSNVCQHRGVEVIQGSGNTGEFQCPYHLVRTRIPAICEKHASAGVALEPEAASPV